MPDFIWVLPRDKAASFGDVGVSSTYILPHAHAGINASNLVNSFIWIVLRGENDRLALVIKAQSIEKILDGYYKDDFMLTPDLQNSLRIGTAFNQLSSFTTDVSAFSSLGISVISLADAQKLYKLLKINAAVRLTSPTDKSLSNFIVENPPKNHHSLARIATQTAVSSFNFIDIWSDGRHKKYRTAPYASMARAYIENKFKKINLIDIDDELVSSDPYASISNRKFESIQATYWTATSGNAPRVDAIFTTLDPNKVFAREFRASDLNTLNPIDRIKKTEAAEQRHQEILRDVACYLLSKGLQPFQSNSVDLAYMLSATLFVFEIKTANLENAITQASKGAFQLACYKNALSAEYESIAISLLLEDTGSAELNSFILDTMQTLGISTYFYNGEVEWPFRLSNLPLR